MAVAVAVAVAMLQQILNWFNLMQAQAQAQATIVDQAQDQAQDQHRAVLVAMIMATILIRILNLLRQMMTATSYTMICVRKQHLLTTHGCKTFTNTSSATSSKQSTSKKRE